MRVTLLFFILTLSALSRADECYFIPSPLIEGMAEAGHGSIYMGIDVQRNCSDLDFDYLYNVPARGRHYWCFTFDDHFRKGRSELPVTPFVSTTCNADYGSNYESHRVQIDCAVGYMPDYSKVPYPGDCEVLLYKGPHNPTPRYIGGLYVPNGTIEPPTQARIDSLRCRGRACAGAIPQVADVLSGAAACVGAPEVIGTGLGIGGAAASVAADCAAYAGMGVCEWSRYVAGAAAGVALPAGLIGAGVGCAANAFYNYDELRARRDFTRGPLGGPWRGNGRYGNPRCHKYLYLDPKSGRVCERCF